MSKSVLVIDTPEDCIQCPLLTGSDECMVQDDDTNFNADTLDDLRQRCPLRDLPEKNTKSYFPDEFGDGYATDWNACIDEITGGE